MGFDRRGTPQEKFYWCPVAPTFSGNDVMADDPRTLWRDPVIEFYKHDVDRTLLRENLKLTPAERLETLRKLVEFAEELRRAMTKAKAER